MEKKVWSNFLIDKSTAIVIWGAHMHIKLHYACELIYKPHKKKNIIL